MDEQILQLSNPFAHLLQPRQCSCALLLLVGGKSRHNRRLVLVQDPGGLAHRRIHGTKDPVAGDTQGIADAIKVCLHLRGDV